MAGRVFSLCRGQRDGQHELREFFRYLEHPLRTEDGENSHLVLPSDVLVDHPVAAPHHLANVAPIDQEPSGPFPGTDGGVRSPRSTPALSARHSAPNPERCTRRSPRDRPRPEASSGWGSRGEAFDDIIMRNELPCLGLSDAPLNLGHKDKAFDRILDGRVGRKAVYSI